MSFKIRQKVWSPLFGWGHVCNTYPTSIDVVPCIKSRYNSDIIYTFDLNGFYSPFHDSIVPLLFHDEVKIEDWPNPQRNPVLDLKMDDLILVSNNNEYWLPRYFAKYENENIFVFTNGTTSKTCGSITHHIMTYKFWKKPE
jgi:hypothetical protein